MKKDMKSALKKSLIDEQKTIQDRFEKAETLFAEKKPVENQIIEKKEAPPEKTKVVRDSFTMPVDDYELIENLKKRSLQSGHQITKSEILRAGLLALNRLDDNNFLDQIREVEKIKTGRPKQTV